MTLFKWVLVLLCTAENKLWQAAFLAGIIFFFYKKNTLSLVKPL